MKSAIMEFGAMLESSKNYGTVGKGGPAFAWASPGDIVIEGEAPENPHGRVCLVKVDGESKSMFCRLYVDGDKIKLGYMDDYDIWKIVPADAVTVKCEVLGVVHRYEPIELPKATTAWEKRAKRALKEAVGKFTYSIYDNLMKHHKHSNYETLATAFCLGYAAGKKDGATQ